VVRRAEDPLLLRAVPGEAQQNLDNRPQAHQTGPHHPALAGQHFYISSRKSEESRFCISSSDYLLAMMSRYVRPVFRGMCAFCRNRSMSRSLDNLAILNA
jgi:hypothetical protein